MWEARSLLGVCLSEARDLAKIVASLSHADEGHLADQWREKLRIALIDLVTNMKNLVTNESLTNFVISGERYPIVDAPERVIVEDVSENNSYENGSGGSAITQPRREVAMDPFQISVEVHLLINNHAEFLGRQIEIQREVLLHQILSSFTQSHYVLLQFASTPVPFPTTQMAQTILLIWMCLLPCVLFHYTETLKLEPDCDNGDDYCGIWTKPDTGVCSSKLNDLNTTNTCLDNLVESMNTEDDCSCERDINVITGFVLIVASFFGTYGFWGLERVAEELDLPFGEDPNDIEVEALSDVIIKNINGYLTYQLDRVKRNEMKERRGKSKVFIPPGSGAGDSERFLRFSSFGTTRSQRKSKGFVQFADNIDTPMYGGGR